MTVVVEAIGGLCNRLRVVLAYRAAYGRVDVVWQPTGEIAGARFGDIFEPLEGVRFLDGYADPVLRTTDPLHGVPWVLGYRDLVLQRDHRDRLSDIRAAVGGPYQAVHVRRTDLDVHLRGLLPPDDEWLAWAREQPGPIFVATDNGTTQRELVAALNAQGRESFFVALIPEHAAQDQSNQRNTSLADAALDLFLCAGASAFRGTFGSSFSETAEALRQSKGWWT
jgi:hypothetical protein